MNGHTFGLVPIDIVYMQVCRLRVHLLCNNIYLRIKRYSLTNFKCSNFYTICTLFFFFFFDSFQLYIYLNFKTGLVGLGHSHEINLHLRSILQQNCLWWYSIAFYSSPCLSTHLHPRFLGSPPLFQSISPSVPPSSLSNWFSEKY